MGSMHRSEPEVLCRMRVAERDSNVPAGRTGRPEGGRSMPGGSQSISEYVTTHRSLSRQG